MSEGVVLTVPNKHIAQSGKAPNLNASNLKYCSYFENDYGEQLVITFDGNTAYLYHGDDSWEQPQEIINGFVSGIILSGEELSWLAICWKQIKLRVGK